MTFRRMPKHRTFEVKKITKCEQRVIGTLINISLVKERAFYCLNERFVSIITGDTIFSTRSSERFTQQTSHRLADATAETQNFSLK